MEGETHFPKAGGPRARNTGGPGAGKRLGWKSVRPFSPGLEQGWGAWEGLGVGGGAEWGGREKERRNKVQGMVV